MSCDLLYRNIHICYAAEVRPGDELLVGPMGHRIETAPTVLSIKRGVHRDLDCFIVELIDDSGVPQLAYWTEHNCVTVYRRPQ